MGIFITIMTIIIYITFIIWTWQSMQTVEIPKKIAFILIGAVIIYLITTMIFFISKTGINYENIEIQEQVKNLVVSAFSGFNCVIIMPQIARNYEKFKNGDIRKEQFLKIILIFTVIAVVCLIFECGYMKSTQEGILNYAKR